MFVQFKEGIHDVFCSVECRFIQGTVIDIQYFRYFSEKILLGSSGPALILCDTDIGASFIETGGNASSNFPIPYTEKMDHYELNERTMFLRSLLDVQIQPENLYERIRSVWDRSVPFIGTALPAGIKSKIIVREGRKTDTASYTYGISYAGKVCFGDEIDPHVCRQLFLSLMDTGL